MLLPLLFIVNTKAQFFNKDSLQFLLSTLPDNSDKINAYIDYAVFLENSHTDSSLYFYNKAAHLSTRLNDHEGKMRYARNYSALLNQLGRLQESLLINRWALGLATEQKDTLNMAKCETNLANVYNHLGHYETAITHYLQATSLFELLADNQYLNIIYQNLSVLFDAINQYQRSLEYAEKSLLLSHSTNDSSTMSSTMINMANTLNSLKLYDSAIIKATQGLELGKQIQNQYNQLSALIVIGNSYAQLQKYQQSLENYRTALQLARHLKFVPEITASLHGIATNYYKMNDFVQANRFAVEALKFNKENFSFQKLLQHYELLAGIKNQLGEFDKAYYYLKQYQALHDSVTNVITKKNINELDRKYQVAIKEKEVAEKQFQLDATKLKVQRRNIWMAIMGAGILGAGILLIASFKLQRSRQKLHLEKLTSLQKEKELAQLQASLNGQLTERKRIAAEMHDDLGTGLTSIMFLAERIRKSPLPSMTDADKIAHTTRKLMNQLNEIIWSMNTDYDTLEDLIAYVRHTTADFLDNVQMEYAFFTPDEIPEYKVSGIVRRNVYLVIKEVLHNIVKHADATKVKLTFSFKDKLCIQINDNGKGIDSANLRQFGNGLKNMRQRMETIGGSFLIEQNAGTTILLNAPLEI